MRYERLTDLLRLAIRLQGRSGGMSLNDIMNEFRVSRSTAERMRNAIEAAFPQIEELRDYDRQKRWRIPSQTIGKMSDPTIDELSALKRGADISRRQGDAKTADQLVSLQDRLRSSMNSKSKRRLEPDLEVLLEADGVASRPGPREIIDRDVLYKIRDAILRGNWINIDHRGRSQRLSKNGRLGPLAMLLGEGTQYLVAWSEYQDDIRLFTLAGIERIEIENDVFERPENFNLQNYIDQSFGVFQDQVSNIEWKFSPNVADKAAKYQFHPSQKIEENDDGSLTVKFKASGFVEMSWHLFRWGNDVTVVKPKALRNKYHNLLKQVIEHEEETNDRTV